MVKVICTRRRVRSGVVALHAGGGQHTIHPSEIRIALGDKTKTSSGEIGRDVDIAVLMSGSKKFISEFCDSAEPTHNQQ